MIEPRGQEAGTQTATSNASGGVDTTSTWPVVVPSIWVKKIPSGLE
jgi:hypothetical protein